MLLTCGHGNNVCSQHEAHPASGLVAYLHIHVDLRVTPALFGWRFSLKRRKHEDNPFCDVLILILLNKTAQRHPQRPKLHTHRK